MAKLTPEQWQAKYRKWQKKFPDLVSKGLERGAMIVIARAQKAYLSGPSPGILRTRSGILRRSLTHRMSRSPRVSATIGTSVKYAAIHEYGGVIEAKNKPYLVFQIGGRWIRTKSVKMPKRPFLAPAVEDSREKVMKQISRAIVDGYDGR